MEVPSECRQRSANQLYLVLIHHEGQSVPEELTPGGGISEDSPYSKGHDDSLVLQPHSCKDHYFVKVYKAV